MYWKEWPKKRSRGEAPRLELWFVLCVFLILVVTVAQSADKVMELQDRFDKETQAPTKIKALDKLAEAQFAAAGKAGDLGDYVKAVLTFEKYRDNVLTTLQLLKKQEPDVDRHAAGYRQLELQVRKGIREVEGTLMIAPLETRPPMEIVRKDLLDVDDELIHLLFPGRPKNPGKAPAVPTAKP